MSKIRQAARGQRCSLRVSLPARLKQPPERMS